VMHKSIDIHIRACIHKKFIYVHKTMYTHTHTHIFACAQN
jgi:hypothetical protein